MIMAKIQKPYRKLSTNRFTLFYTNALWQGDDHLLRVEAGMMTERYWRFYFKDIQAVVLHRTATYHYWSALWAILTLGWGLTLFIDALPTPISIILTGLFLLLLLINLILGPSCQVHLQTAVQVQKMPGLKRQRKARKVMDLIRQAVESVQGVFDPATSKTEQSRQPDAHEGQLAYHQAPGTTAAGTASPAGPLAFTIWLHQVLFTILLLGAIVNGWHLFQPSSVLVVIAHALLLVAIIWVIIALVRNHASIKGRPLAKVTWTAVVFIAVQGLAVYILYIIATIRNPHLVYDNWGMLTAYMDLHVSDFPFRVGVTAAFAAMDLILGGIGFLALLTDAHPDRK
jgi:hypothetical protein